MSVYAPTLTVLTLWDASVLVYFLEIGVSYNRRCVDRCLPTFRLEFTRYESLLFMVISQLSEDILLLPTIKDTLNPKRSVLLCLSLSLVIESLSCKKSGFQKFYAWKWNWILCCMQTHFTMKKHRKNEIGLNIWNRNIIPQV